MAGKRPAEDQQLRNAAPAKKWAHHSNRLHLGAPPPPPQGNGMQAPLKMLGYYGGSGQPMGYQAGAPMPLPLVAYNNGQVHVPPQQAAYSGQVPMMTRQPAVYNCQVPVMTRQPAAYNGQVPVTQQQVAFNGQVRPPPCRPAGSPNSCGQNLTMMTRPSCPAGQAVNQQMQKQAETDEMLEKRVLRQNLEEHLRMQSEIHPAQQQQRPMALTQQQQQQVMAFTPQQQQAMAFMMRQQQQRTMAFMMQQHRPCSGANANCHHHAGGKAPQFSLDDFYASVAAEHYKRSRVVLPATSGSPGEVAPVKAEGSPVSTVVSVGGSGDSNNRDGGSHDLEESAAVKASPGGSASAEGEMAPSMIRHSDRC